MGNQQHQGTGRHGHKDTEERWPHTKENRGQQSQSGSHQQQQGSSQQQGSAARRQQQQDSGRDSDRSEQESLKAREYRDENGQIRRHTRTYMEQHGKEGGGRQDR